MIGPSSTAGDWTPSTQRRSQVEEAHRWPSPRISARSTRSASSARPWDVHRGRPGRADLRRDGEPPAQRVGEEHPAAVLDQRGQAWTREDERDPRRAAPPQALAAGDTEAKEAVRIAKNRLQVAELKVEVVKKAAARPPARHRRVLRPGQAAGRHAHRRTRELHGPAGTDGRGPRRLYPDLPPPDPILPERPRP